jgi:trk system potassium uptake protein TrkA
VDELPLPAGVVIGVVSREGRVIIARRETVLEAEDRIVMFLADKTMVADVEKLFQVGITFV